MNFGPRKSTVPRYTRQFQTIGPLASLGEGASLAQLGAEGGTAPVLFAALNRVGGALIQEGHNRRVKAITEAATAEGLAEGERAALEGRMVALRDEEALGAKAFNESVKSGYFARLDLMVTGKAEEIFREHANDPEGFASRWDSMAGQVLGQMPDQWRRPIKLELDHYRQKYAGQIRESVLKEEAGQANATLLTAANQYAERASAAFRTGDEAEARLNAEKYRLTIADRTDLSPQEKAQARIRFQDMAARQTVLGEFDRLIDAKGPEAAEKFIKSFRKDDAVADPDRRARIATLMEARLADVVSGVKANRKEAETVLKEERERRYAAVDLAISRRQYGYEHLEEDNAAGLFADDPDKYTDFAKAIDRNHKEDNAKAEAVQKVTDALGGHGILDPGDAGDRKAVDAYFERRVAEAPESALPVAIALAEKTSVLPETVESTLAHTVRHGEPQARAEAADLIARLDETAPVAVNHLPADVRTEARLISRLVAAGTDPGKAAERAEESVRKAGAPEREGRKKALTAKHWRDVDGWLKGELDDEWFGDTGLSEPLVWDRVSGDFQSLYEDEFLRSGDEDVARARALADFKRAWGVTGADGSRRWMKYAPERTYGVFGDPEQDGEWMREQLFAELSAGGMWDRRKKLEGRIRLIADSEAARMYDGGKFAPAYIVMRRDEETGAWNPVGDPEARDGLLRWRPDWQSSPKFKRLEAERKGDAEKAIEEARKIRKGAGAWPLSPDDAREVLD